MRAALAAAVLAPAAGAVAALVPGRTLRRGLWFAAQAAAVAGAAICLWEAYGGDPVVWRSFRGGLFAATFAVSLHLGTVLAGARAVSLEARAERLAHAGLGAAATGAAAVALTTSAATLALFVVVPTLGVLAATLSGGRRALPATGLAGLALADLAAVGGVWLMSEAADATLLPFATPDRLGAALLLAAAAVKCGCVPWVGTWAAEGSAPARLAQVGVRAQGLALAAVVAFGAGPAIDGAWLAGAAGALALACGASALVPGRERAGLAGIAPAAAGLCLALGGAVGASAFVLLVTALPVLWGGAGMLLTPADPPSPPPPGPAQAPRAPARPLAPGWGIASIVAAGGVAGSLALLPLTAAFPGAWLGLALASVRAGADPTWLIPVAAIALGSAAACVGAVRLVRQATASRLAAAGLALVAGSLYAGVASGRLAAGWLARVSAGLGLPSVLAPGGAPAIPPGPALDLALAVLPGLVAVGAMVALTRGVRVPGPEPAPGRSGRALPPPAAAFAAAAGVVRGLRAGGQAWGLVLAAEALALVVAARVVLAASGRGFL